MICKKKAAHHMMRYGAYAMCIDGGVKLLGAMIALVNVGHIAVIVEHLHVVVGILGANGAAIAGIGAVIDFSVVEASMEAQERGPDIPFGGLGG